MQTKILVADFENWRDAVAEAVALLEEGELVGMPTETVYGLAAHALNPQAVAKIFEVKERPTFDPLIVHVGRKKDIHLIAKIPEELDPVVRQLTETFWPGPLTLILPKQPEIPDLVTSGLPTVAVRMSAHEVMLAACKQLPLAAPSANRFGRLSPTSAQAVVDELGGKIPLVIDGGACRDGLESTIVAPEMTEKGPVLRLLRPGPISRDDLRTIAKVIRPKLTRQERIEAPGQLTAHYAPATPLIVIENPADFTPDPNLKYGLLSYCGEGKRSLVEATDWAHLQILSPGKGKLSEAAVRLFYCLRQLDASGVDVIVAEAVSETGIGVAMMDRLRRAQAAHPKT